MNSGEALRLLKRWFFAQGAVLLLLLPWLILFSQKVLPASRGDTWRRAVAGYGGLLLKILSSTTGNLKGEYPAWGLWPFILLIGAGWLTLSRKRIGADFHRNDFILLSWLVIPLFTMLLYNAWVSPFLTPLTIRYIGSIHIPFLLAAAKGLSKFPRGPRTVVLLVLTLLAAGKSLPDYYGGGRPSEENWRELFCRLEETAGHNDLVILYRGLVHPYHYYSRSPGLATLYASDLKRVAIKPGYDSIFLPYRQWGQRKNFRELPGYELVGHLSCGNIGIYQFKKRP